MPNDSACDLHDASDWDEAQFDGFSKALAEKHYAEADEVFGALDMPIGQRLRRAVEEVGVPRECSDCACTLEQAYLKNRTIGIYLNGCRGPWRCVDCHNDRAIVTGNGRIRLSDTKGGKPCPVLV